MKQFDNYNFTRPMVVIIALVMISAGVFSMAAMNHGPNNAGTCMIGMAEHTGCNNSVQAQTCIEFHFGLLEKFSHGFADRVGLKLLSALLILGFVYFAVGSLLSLLCNRATILKVRLRQLKDDTVTVFRDNLGFWLSFLEKRDPSYAFIIA
jgi:hypothetical protein